MRIKRKVLLRVPTYLLTLQPPNTTFFPLIGSLSSTILVSTLHHHLFIDPIAFIYSHHWQQRVLKSSIICLMSKYSYNPIKYNNEISVSQIIKREFGKEKVNFVIWVFKARLLLLSWLKHFWGISIDRQRCKIWTGGQTESWRKMIISDCEEDMAWFLDTNYLSLSLSFPLSLSLTVFFVFVPFFVFVHVFYLSLSLPLMIIPDC